MSLDPKQHHPAFERMIGFQRILQLVLGLAVVAAGVLFTLDNLEVLRARDYLIYWPALLIILGAAQIAQARQGRFLGGTSPPFLGVGAIWILIGTAMLGRRLGFIPVDIRAFWPLFLVGVGAWILWHGFHPRYGPETSVDDVSRVSSTAFMGGFGRKILSQSFQGGELTAIMGGGKVDLREAALANGQAVLNLFVVMGGFEIIVPPTWSVITEITPFMGGFEDKTRQNVSATAPRLFIRGFVMMGGVEIKNPRVL